MTSVGSAAFSDHEIKLIAASLPDGIDQYRLSLLPRILRAWSAWELATHLEEPSKMSTASRRELKRLETKLNDILRELDARDLHARFYFAYNLATGQGRSPLAAAAAVDQTLERVRDFLTRLAVAAKAENPRRGRPSHTVELQVISDIAAIFEWVTGRRATRQFDRISQAETGPFRQFAEAIWPVVFGKGDAGLTTAMRNWESAGRKASPIIRQIAWRHPTWQIFDPTSLQ